MSQVMSIEKITKEHNLSQSENLVESNIDKLKALFPEIVTEGKIDFNVLQEVLGDELEHEEEYYRFTWAGKANARREAQKPSTGTLRPAPEESVDWDTTKNLYIEGDNLEVLKLLQKGYAGKVKMIYIDPPYNTGNDFVYKDNYKDNLRNYQEVTGQVDDEGNKLSTNSDSDGRYHSNWLNMMYPRLRLARNLLSEDGVIFMSIDDNEVDNLKKMGSEVFGEENFLGMFIVNSSPSGIDYGHLAKTNDYALFFSKNNEETTTNQLEELDKKFKYQDEQGGFNLYPLYNGNSAFNDKTRPNLVYPFYLNPDNNYAEEFYEINVDKHEGWIEIFPVIGKKDGIQRVWRWGKPKSKENLNDEIVGLKNREGEYRIVQKSRHTSKVIRSLQLDNEVSSRRGTLEIESLLGEKVFSYPKPSKLIQRFCEVGSEKDSIVLDFFSGSSSSAHATMQLNAEDGGNRKFIQVQLPELTDEKSQANKAGYKTITEIGKDRIRKAAKKIKEEHPEKAKELDLGFKVFKLDTSNIKGWDGNPENLDESLFDTQDNIKTDRTEHDVLYEILLKYGLDLTLPIEEKQIAGKTVFSVGYGALFICLANDITNNVAQGIGEWKEELQPEVCRVVFKDSGFTDVEKTNSVQTLKCFGITEIKSI
jgi:adenine-specific DNA-methyltransferase